MTFGEESDFGGDLKTSDLCEHTVRKTTPRPPSREEGHAVRAVKPGVWNKRWRGVRAEVKHVWGLVCDSAFVPTLGYQTTLACSKRYQPVLLGKSGDHVLSALKEERVFDRALKIPVDHLKFFGDCFPLSFSEIPSIFTGGQVGHL